jgi:hypothetical protein
MKKLLLLACLFTFIITNQIQAQNGLALDGANDYISTSITSLTGSTNRTIEAWIKTGNVTNQRVIVGMGTMPIGTRFTLNVLQGKLRIEIGGGGINSTKDIDDNAWHHVAVTYDNSATTKYKLYIDGSLDASGNITAATLNVASGTGVAIGRRNDAVNYFNGTIDEVRIWNTVRTAAEIQANMSKEFCGTKTGLIGYYKLNQGTANGNNSMITTATDDSGNNKTGTLNGFGLSGSTSNWTTGLSSLAAASTTSTISPSVCSSYTSPSGMIYLASGTYTDIIPNSSGCDSVITINLSVNNSFSNFVANSCGSYTAPSGTVYTSTQLVNDTISNAAGCDSVMLISVNIFDVDTSVTQMGDTLMANEQGGTYQWIDCDNGNSAIANATDASFMPATSGIYAVVVTSAQNCSDTSNCHAVILTNTNNWIANNKIKFYPNPVQNNLYIEMSEFIPNTSISIMNLLGQEIRQVETLSQNETLNLSDIPNGVYFINITNNGKVLNSQKIVIQK